MEPKDQDTPADVHDGRLPYEKPAVISEEVFETLALSCARANSVVCRGGNPDRS